MLTMLFCTAFGSTQQTECVDALSNTENSQYAFKLRYEEKYQLMLTTFSVLTAPDLKDVRI